MKNHKTAALTHHLKSNQVYRRETLAPFSKAIDRDLAKLVNEGTLKKAAPGLYYKPKLSRFGELPPDEKHLVKSFLRDEHFLLLNPNDYNSLQLGLTQLYNHTVVYNHKRHGSFDLAGKKFEFRRPARGFPQKPTAAFLLVDLLNNLKSLADENSNQVKKNATKLDKNLLLQAEKLAKRYGKVSTQKFFQQLSLG